MYHYNIHVAQTTINSISVPATQSSMHSPSQLSHLKIIRNYSILAGIYTLFELEGVYSNTSSSSLDAFSAMMYQPTDSFFPSTKPAGAYFRFFCGIVTLLCAFSSILQYSLYHSFRYLCLYASIHPHSPFNTHSLIPSCHPLQFATQRGRQPSF